MAHIEKRTHVARDGKRSTYWRARYTDPHGVGRSKTFTRKADADAFVVTVEADKLRGEWRDPKLGRRLFGEVAREWQAAQVHDESTAALVDNALRNHILPTFEHRPLAAIRTSEVQAWVKGRSEVLAPSTLGVVYRWLAAIFAAAVGDGIIGQSPCRGVKRPTVEKPLVVPLAAEAVFALAGAVPERYRALVVATAGTGLRQGEAFGLTVTDVDFLRRTVHVRRQVKLLAGRPPFLAPPKTPSSLRAVPLPDVVLEALSEHVRRFPPVGEQLFTDEDGRLLHRGRFNTMWRKAAAAAGVAKGTGFHDLRHFYASALIASGASVKVVQARLGHKSALETLDTYGHLWPQDDDLTRRAIDAVLAATPNRHPTEEAMGL
ncbi:MAG: tyrosine-type recombinase/integrase [Acidimicrobiia bacterium]